MFIDKPVSASLEDTLAIYAIANKLNVPIFSSSSLRWAPGAQAARRGDFGAVLGCDAYSPCSLEPTQPDLFWYGIHGVEMLFTAMGELMRLPVSSVFSVVLLVHKVYPRILHLLSFACFSHV